MSNLEIAFLLLATAALFFELLVRLSTKEGRKRFKSFVDNSYCDNDNFKTLEFKHDYFGFPTSVRLKHDHLKSLISSQKAAIKRPIRKVTTKAR